MYRSGKSSMMIALFRIQELAAGKIFIDDIDISTVPLKLLRSKLGIIPQDPVMFSATIRFNLDPFDEHTDEELWYVLESVNMKDHVLSLSKGLLEDVAEGGDNFSAGQRQVSLYPRWLSELTDRFEAYLHCACIASSSKDFSIG